MTTPKIDTQKRSFFQDRKMWFWIAAGSGLVTVIVLVVFLQSLISTTKYYVLNQDVASRTLITEDMLQEQVVSSGGEPPTALDITDVQMGELYSKADLGAGDILTASNIGDLIPLRQGIPDDFVIASFSADPNKAAGGNVKRGDYVDIFHVLEDQASLLFQRVLIIDTTADLIGGDPAAATEEEGAAAAPAATAETATASYRGGIPSLYTVGITQDDALKLSTSSANGTYYVVLSSVNDIKNGATEKTLGMSISDLLSSPAGDSGKDTDSTFGEKKKEDSESSSDTSASPSPSPSSSTTSDGESETTVVETEAAEPETETEPTEIEYETENQ